MAILSKRIVLDVGRSYHREHGLRVQTVDMNGQTRATDGRDVPGLVSQVRRKRSVALQESINLGGVHFFSPVPGVTSWIVGLEDRRGIHGGLLGGEVHVVGWGEKPEATREYLESHGVAAAEAERYGRRLPIWTEARARGAARALQDTFYEISGWHPDLMNENRLKTLQQEQINQALDDQRRTGRPVLYAFEKERALLANIRAGDRNAARRILNEMLAGIYLTSPQLVVLRARAVELLSYLTRAAIEDNPLLEPLIVRNHLWTERLVRAGNFEELSQFLTEALDGFIDAIYLHGTNRSNGKVHKALDFIAANFARKISLDEVAKEVSLSTSRLSHLIREMTGKTVLGTLLQIRIQHAQHLLERTAKSCAEIAYETGFGDQSYFIKHFRRAMGVTPARYRRKR